MTMTMILIRGTASSTLFPLMLKFPTQLTAQVGTNQKLQMFGIPEVVLEAEGPYIRLDFDNGHFFITMGW